MATLTLADRSPFRVWLHSNADIETDNEYSYELWNVPNIGNAKHTRACRPSSKPLRLGARICIPGTKISAGRWGDIRWHVSTRVPSERQH